MLAALLLVVVEVWLLVRVGHLVGGGWILVLLLAETFGGALVLRRAGRRALTALRGGVLTPSGVPAPGRSPGAVGDVVLAGAGGALLVLPGLISDVLGLLCLFPPTRRLLRRSFARLVRRRVEGAVRRAGGQVVQGEVVGRARSCRARSSKGRSSRTRGSWGAEVSTVEVGPRNAGSRSTWWWTGPVLASIRRCA